MFLENQAYVDALILDNLSNEEILYLKKDVESTILEKSEFDEQKMLHQLLKQFLLDQELQKNPLIVEKCTLVAIMIIMGKYLDLLQNPLEEFFSNYGTWIVEMMTSQGELDIVISLTTGEILDVESGLTSFHIFDNFVNGRNLE